MPAKRGKNKQITGFVAKLSSMTPSEKAEWYSKRRDRIAVLRGLRRDELREWKQETLAKLSDMIREDTLQLDDPAFKPTELTLWKIHGFLSQGFSIVDIRDSLLQQNVCTEVGWNKLKKLLFEKSLSKIEDLGFDIFSSQQQVREGIQHEIKYLQRMKRAKPHDVNIPKAIIDANERLHRVQTELTRLFGAVGVVGEKKKGGHTINFYSGVPRPKSAKEIDVTPQNKTPPENP